MTALVKLRGRWGALGGGPAPDTGARNLLRTWATWPPTLTRLQCSFFPSFRYVEQSKSIPATTVTTPALVCVCVCIP